MSYEPELLAYAADMHIDCTDSSDAGVWFMKAKDFFDGLTVALKKPGVVIGHIKGFLELDNGAYAYLSNAGLLGTDVKAQGEGSAQKGRLGFNVLVYGVESHEVEEKVEQAMAALAKELSAKCVLEKAA